MSSSTTFVPSHRSIGVGMNVILFFLGQKKWKESSQNKRRNCTGL